MVIIYTGNIANLFGKCFFHFDKILDKERSSFQVCYIWQFVMHIAHAEHNTVICHW